MRGSNAPFFVAMKIDGVEFIVNWAEDQLLDPQAPQGPGTSEPAAMPDFAGMKKAELVEYISPDGNDVDTSLTKAELIKLAEDLYAAKG